jgi:hypothetical protein
MDKTKKGIRRWYGKFPWILKPLSKNVMQTETGCFEIKQSQHGKGCFTLQSLPVNTLVGVYPGRIISEKQLSIKMSQLTIPQQKGTMDYLVQSKLHSTDKSKCYLDPTTQGHIDPSWADNPVLYCNEPDLGQTLNLQHIWNYDNDRLELWTSRPVEKNEELLVSYGRSYQRDYKVGQVSGAEWMLKDGKLLPVS